MRPFVTKRTGGSGPCSPKWIPTGLNSTRRETGAAVLVHTVVNPAVIFRPAQLPAPVGARRRVLGRSILEKRPARQREHQVRWPDRSSKGMNASGWKTAPPQVLSEVVSVTNSACLSLLEASRVSPIDFVINQFASKLDVNWTQPALSFCSRLHPSVDSASRSRILSVAAVSGA
jgi:hypothetical protein